MRSVKAALPIAKEPGAFGTNERCPKEARDVRAHARDGVFDLAHDGGVNIGLERPADILIDAVVAIVDFRG